ncbi:MAG: DUF1566 domain-containing protein [Rhizobiales bacterium]|jgi:hypothetical protein|nr:DUF1566 domain-containing protein [Hyphomicrobiales bacterium]
MEDYKCEGDTVTYRACDTLAAWNLIWLSLPQVDQLLNPKLDFVEFAKGFDFGNVGRLTALSRWPTDDGQTGVAEMMGPSPIQFVQDLQDYLNLPASSIWLPLGGQAWIDTMVARAYQVDDMADAYKAAQSSSKIVLVDFSSEKKCKITLNRTGSDKQVRIDELQPRAELALLHNNNRQDDENESEGSTQTVNTPTHQGASITDTRLLRPVTDAMDDKAGPFVDNGDGTVTDTRTNLTWMRCALGQTWNGINCTGEATTFSWDNAIEISYDFSGRDDWRLPSLDELDSLIEPQKDNIIFNVEAFPNTPIAGFWSNSTNIYDSMNAWHLGFDDGGAYNIGKDNNCYIRLVRGGKFSVELNVIELIKPETIPGQSIGYTESTTINNIATFTAWLFEQDFIPLAELRIRLLPLDLLPSAVINDINERAIDLTGDLALLEDGDNVIVQREVLMQVIAT